jgi:hypothetical protein
MRRAACEASAETTLRGPRSHPLWCSAHYLIDGSSDLNSHPIGARRTQKGLFLNCASGRPLCDKQPGRPVRTIFSFDQPARLPYLLKCSTVHEMSSELHRSVTQTPDELMILHEGRITANVAARSAGDAHRRPMTSSRLSLKASVAQQRSAFHRSEPASKTQNSSPQASCSPNQVAYR